MYKMYIISIIHVHVKQIKNQLQIVFNLIYTCKFIHFYNTNK